MRVVCPNEFMTRFCRKPLYVLPEGKIGADVSAAMTEAEAAALDACEVKLLEVQNCILRHGWEGENK